MSSSPTGRTRTPSRTPSPSVSTMQLNSYSLGPTFVARAYAAAGGPARPRVRALPVASALDAGGVVRRAGRLGLGRAALAQVDREDGHRADGQELGLPVLQRA